MKAGAFTASKFKLAGAVLAVAALAAVAGPLAPLGPEPPAQPFSISYMDRSISPGTDFYSFAVGQWIKDNPVPDDKPEWTLHDQLDERNSYLIHALLEEAAAGKGPRGAARRAVGDFYASAMDTNRLERLRFKPLAADLKRIDRLKSREDLFRLLGRFHDQGVGGVFDGSVSGVPRSVGPALFQSPIYTLVLEQGGLSLPDRDYYLKECFAPQRQAYREHVAKMLGLLGQKPDQAATCAGIVVELETELARASVMLEEEDELGPTSRKFTRAELLNDHPAIGWQAYLSERGLAEVPYVVVSQPEFLKALDKLLGARPLSDWQAYLRWHLLRASAPFLCRDAEVEDFNFNGKVLEDTPHEAPRWLSASWTLNENIGEVVHQLYVQKYFPPEARMRLDELVENLKAAFREHLQKAPWMSEATRAKALAKFARCTYKIGSPDKFCDYSSVKIKRDDYLGNVRRAQVFNPHRKPGLVGKPVSHDERDWDPQSLDAHFLELLNEVFVPAGMLQPPYFDLTRDDAVNYGAIGTLIGHEMMHGYDADGSQLDAEGKEQPWWTEQDRKAWEARAQKLIDEYDAFEPLPGLHVDGKKTLTENVADLVSVRIAYDALQRALARDPSKRKLIDGFTPEQRFFISFAQLWRSNIREADLRDGLADDKHAPDRFRAIGPLMNFQEFFDAFSIQPGDPMWRAPELRAQLW